MEKLPPIPTPASAQWREFRYQYLPGITFLLVVAVVVFMWRNYVVPPNVLAEVEPIRANVISAQPGLLTSLTVERFQHVTNGQEIAQIQIMETNVLSASLGVIEANLAMKNEQLDLLVRRDNMIYERERLDFLQEQVQFNMNKELLPLYTSNYMRMSNLWFRSTPPLVSAAQYDDAFAQYQKCKAGVEGNALYLAEKEKALPKLKVDASNLVYFVTKDIQAQADRLLNAQSNITLRAPIDGIVSVVNHRPGERVIASTPIVVITPLQSDRIIAYVRQPINTVPHLNDWVMVRRQTYKRETGYGKVALVGAQLDQIDPALLLGSTKTDMGLPFVIKMRDKMDLSPGERVDVILNPRIKPEVN